MKVLALAGGVGGGRMAHGLQQVVPAGDLSVVVNTGDDFWLHGLRICPDLDTVTYTLADLENPSEGWGIRGETFHALDMLERLGAPSWFRLGDRDFALHIFRTQQLREGRPLTEIVQQIAGGLGVPTRLFPMCEEPVETKIHAGSQVLDFQEYFVHRRQQDEVTDVSFPGIQAARPPEGLLAAWEAATRVVICPSNPFVSVQPILCVPGLRDRLRATSVPRVCVSPIVAGQSIKGPAARMMSSLGHEPSVVGIARLYSGLIDVIVIDEADEPRRSELEALGLEVRSGQTVMRSAADRAAVAHLVLA